MTPIDPRNILPQAASVTPLAETTLTVPTTDADTRPLLRVWLRGNSQPLTGRTTVTEADLRHHMTGTSELIGRTTVTEADLRHHMTGTSELIGLETEPSGRDQVIKTIWVRAKEIAAFSFETSPRAERARAGFN
jgi:hypothetical protein